MRRRLRALRTCPADMITSAGASPRRKTRLEPMRILIVEDDPLIGRGLSIGLRQDGYSVDWAPDAAAAEHALRIDHFDALVLDLGLPGRDGSALLGDLRRQGLQLPILILTARDSLADKVSGLDAGADDYLVKPFDLDELSARLRALIRRGSGHSTSSIQSGDLTLDASRRLVTLAGRPVTLSRREYALLEVLIAHADEVVEHERMQASIYDWEDELESNALQVHIHNLRRKLGKARILTVRGVGYRLVSNPQA